MIIIDLEWNQNPGNLSGEDPDQFIGDIIEIGAVRTDSAYRVTDRYRSLVRPVELPVLSDSVKKLTRISQEEIRMQRPLTEILPEFLAWCGDDRLFGEWGTADETALRQNAELYGIAFPEDIAFTDLQEKFVRDYLYEEERISLGRAVEIMGVRIKGAHDALYDCVNTALIYEKWCPDTLEIINAREEGEE
jgi:inhibitor of KinA sporulation pathway (predicted exonuclease)